MFYACFNYNTRRPTAHWIIKNCITNIQSVGLLSRPVREERTKQLLWNYYWHIDTVCGWISFVKSEDFCTDNKLGLIQNPPLKFRLF